MRSGFVCLLVASTASAFFFQPIPENRYATVPNDPAPPCNCPAPALPTFAPFPTFPPLPTLAPIEWPTLAPLPTLPPADPIQRNAYVQPLPTLAPFPTFPPLKRPEDNYVKPLELPTLPPFPTFPPPAPIDTYVKPLEFPTFAPLPTFPPPAPIDTYVKPLPTLPPFEFPTLGPLPTLPPPPPQAPIDSYVKPLQFPTFAPLPTFPPPAPIDTYVKPIELPTFAPLPTLPPFQWPTIAPTGYVTAPPKYVVPPRDAPEAVRVDGGSEGFGGEAVAPEAAGAADAAEAEKSDSSVAAVMLSVKDNEVAPPPAEHEVPEGVQKQEIPQDEMSHGEDVDAAVGEQGSGLDDNIISEGFVEKYRRVL